VALKKDSAQIGQSEPHDIHSAPKDAVSLHSYVRQKNLILAYLIIPLVLIFCAIDAVFFARSLSVGLPDSPEKVLLFALFFNFPHITASSLLFLNERYLSVYRKKILLGVILATSVCSVIPLTIGFYYLLLLYGFLTINHVIGQQVGLCRTGLSSIGTVFKLWKWTSVLLGSVIYVLIYFKTLGFLDSKALVTISSILLGASSIFGLAIWRKATTNDSKTFIAANQLMLVTIFILAFFNYPFFVILIPRVIHDVCAFMVYYSHDKNRLYSEPKTPIQNVVGFFGIPAVWATPIMAFIFAFPLTLYISNTYGEIAGIGFTLFHYYTEAFAWKRGSEMRSYVSFR
jgi:hypothetical protein